MKRTPRRLVFELSVKLLMRVLVRSCGGDRLHAACVLESMAAGLRSAVEAQP